MTMPCVTFTDQLAVQHVQSRKQRGGAVTLVIVRPRAATAFLQRQPRLRAIQGLNLALFIQTQHQRLLRRVQIQAHHIGQLLQKFCIPRELERLTQMRLELVQLPQSIDRILTHPLRLGHQSATPMCHALGLALQRRFNDPVSFGLIVLRFAPSPGSDLPHFPHPSLVHPLAPQLHRGPIHLKLLSNRDIVLTRQRSQNNPAAQRHLLWRAVRALPTLKLSSFRGGQFERQTSICHESHHSNLRELLLSYLRDTTLVSYATTNLGYSRPTALTAIAVGALIATFTIPLCGLLSDRIGRRPVFLAGSVGLIAFSAPYFWLLSQRST